METFTTPAAESDLVDSELTVWEDKARLLRVTAHPVRLRILEILSQCSRCVKDINSLVPLSQPILSQHMAALRQAGLVDCHTNGALRCYYILRPTLVKKLVTLLRQDHPPQSRDSRSVQREARRHALTAPSVNRKP